MPYSSYSNYLEYKNCKRQTLPCNNNFDSYKKYNRSLNCTRAWWTINTPSINVTTHHKSGNNLNEDFDNTEENLWQDGSDCSGCDSVGNLDDPIDNSLLGDPELEWGKKTKVENVNTTLQNYVFSNPCKCCAKPQCNELTIKKIYDPTTKSYCTGLNKCCNT